MRGLPGSGKTDLARHVMENYGNSGEVLSTDDYFINGHYYFNYSQLKWAHEWNQERAKEAMKNGVHPIVIDNTNITRCDMKPYVLMKKLFFLRNRLKQKFLKMGNRPHLIIMRGLPGSKKTDLAWDIMEKKYCNSGEVLSTDDYFIDEYGRYYFVYSQLRMAHKWNQEKAKEAMKNGVHPIIIDNTNITRRDMEPYVLMGLEYGYYIKFVTAPDHYRCTVDELHADIMEKYGNSGEVLSTDDYFIDEDGNFNFKFHQLKMAHEWNQERAQEAIDNGVHPIIIDNTNMRFRDMRPYVEMGRYRYYITFDTTPDTFRLSVDELHKRANCGIPKSVMYRMKKNYKPAKNIFDVLDDQ